QLIEGKCAILDEIREMETESDLPVSLSIGLGVGGKHPLQNDQFASDALDLALGRAGDQAVIKRGDKIEYYGGKLQAVEKGNKVKSRIVAHALRQLIDQSSKVIIMGHAYQDMDSFGSSLGIFRIAAARGKESWILVNSYNETMTDVYNQAKETGNYPFVNNEKALSLADDETLLIVVDTHRPSLVECRELLDKTDRIVVIDHHRKSEEYIENATLAYMESYASSTAELVTEILQYSLEKKTIIKFEAEALLAGITVDTNSFSVKTGVRTFEAASWLRRSGADTTSVKRYFQTDVNHFKAKANSILNARIRDGIAYSVCEGVNEDMQVVNAQAADELLTIRGVRASFVAGRNEREKTVVSARSLGEINVQTIMETFGGGGHMTTAGASVCMSPEEVLLKIEEYFRKKAK
ncbi:MAG: DHH family phosphoesterase, partial [Eubacteriales bacterium]|nr:DHH family phosphoesterase [Eubacteriales bacterium]